MKSKTIAAKEKKKVVDFNKGKFSREEFNKHFIEGDDIKKTTCCNRAWYKTKKHYKCPGCKEVVTDDIIARGLMQGIDKMMKDREKEEENEKTKNLPSPKTKNDEV